MMITNTDLKILKFLIDLYTMKKSKEETAKILDPDHIENDIRSKL